MSKITAIEVQAKDKSRANLYLDDEFFAGISIELVIKHQLKKDMDIDDKFLADIIFEDDKGKALAKAIKYMGSTMKSCSQIREYLRKKEYAADIIDFVIDKMREYKYLDDEAFARAYISAYSNKYGKIKLIQALKSKGVTDKTIDTVFEDDDLKMQDSIEAVASKYLKNKEITNEVLVKLNRFLYSRGYEFDQINSYIRSFKK